MIGTSFGCLSIDKIFGFSRMKHTKGDTTLHCKILSFLPVMKNFNGFALNKINSKIPVCFCTIRFAIGANR